MSSYPCTGSCLPKEHMCLLIPWEESTSPWGRFCGYGVMVAGDMGLLTVEVEILCLVLQCQELRGTLIGWLAPSETRKAGILCPLELPSLWGQWRKGQQQLERLGFQRGGSLPLQTSPPILGGPRGRTSFPPVLWEIDLGDPL